MSRAKPTPAATTGEPIQADQLPAVVPAPERAIAGWLTKPEILSRKQVVSDLMGSVLKEGEHYGASYPGDTKKALHKQGADTLMMMFQLYAELIVDEREYPGHHREYRITALIKRIGDGLVIAHGVGTCSTLEGKYRYRNAQRRCPGCAQASLIKTKGGRNPGGYWCVPDKGGCGANFNAGDPAVEQQDLGKVENPDPADCWNTCLKMSKKRAVVDGAISATGCSDIFAQDAEESTETDPPPPGATPGAAPPSTKPGPVNDKLAGVNAKADPVNAGRAAPPPPPAEDLAPRLKAGFDALISAGGRGLAGKVWQFFGNDKRAERLKAMTDATAAIAAIQKRLPSEQADKLLGEIINDRAQPDDVVGILADLAKAVPAAAASGSVDEPPF